MIEVRRRRRLSETRTCRRNVRLSREEMADVESAARQAGLTVTGFIADSAVRAARNMPDNGLTRLAAAVVDLQNKFVEQKYSYDVAASIDWICGEIMKLRT